MQDLPDAHRHPLPPPAGRLAWALLGTVAALLALVGFVLPLIPGPPFAILAALCFANVSSRMHARLARMPSMRGAMGHKAIGYMRGEWQRLTVFLEDGRLPLDNNDAENVIRDFAIGHKS